MRAPRRDASGGAKKLQDVESRCGRAIDAQVASAPSRTHHHWRRPELDRERHAQGPPPARVERPKRANQSAPSCGAFRHTVQEAPTEGVGAPGAAATPRAGARSLTLQTVTPRLRAVTPQPTGRDDPTESTGSATRQSCSLSGRSGCITRRAGEATSRETRLDPIVGSQRAGNRDADAAERRLVGARAFNSATYASICCSTQAHRTRECMRRPTAPRLRRCQLRRRRVQIGYKRVAAACCNDLRNLHGSPAFMPFLRLVASRRSLSEATRCPTTPSSFLVLGKGCSQ